MPNTYSDVNMLKLKTAIAITVAPWIGTYQGSENLFSSVPQIFDADTYSPHLWRFESTPSIFDETTLTTLPAIWVRGGDPPNLKVVGGIEVILSKVVKGLPDVRRPEYYKVEFNNYDPGSTMDAAIEAMKKSRHPLVTVSNCTYIPRSGINNEYALFQLTKGIGNGF